MNDKEKLVELINDVIFKAFRCGGNLAIPYGGDEYEKHLKSVSDLADYLGVGYKRLDCEMPDGGYYKRIIFLTTEGRTE